MIFLRCFGLSNSHIEDPLPPTRPNTPQTKIEIDADLTPISLREMLKHDYTPKKIEEINKRAQETFRSGK